VHVTLIVKLVLLPTPATSLATTFLTVNKPWQRSVLVMVTAYVVPAVMLVMGCGGVIVVYQPAEPITGPLHACWAAIGTAGSPVSVTVQFSPAATGTRTGDDVGLLTPGGPFGQGPAGTVSDNFPDNTSEVGPQPTLAVNVIGGVAGIVSGFPVSLTTVLVTTRLAVGRQFSGLVTFTEYVCPAVVMFTGWGIFGTGGPGGAHTPGSHSIVGVPQDANSPGHARRAATGTGGGVFSFTLQVSLPD
jgi:hypothetical protein